jgi:hypothetical protein
VKKIVLKGRNLKKVPALSMTELTKVFGGLFQKVTTGNSVDGIDTYSEDCSGGTTTDTYETSCNNDTDK